MASGISSSNPQIAHLSYNKVSSTVNTQVKADQGVEQKPATGNSESKNEPIDINYSKPVESHSAEPKSISFGTPKTATTEAKNEPKK